MEKDEQTKTDLQLIKEAQQQSKEATALLCERYQPLILHYVRQQHLHSVRDDLKSHLWLVLIEAIQTYDVLRNVPVPAYFKQKIHYGTWNFFKKERKKWQHELFPTSEQGLLIFEKDDSGDNSPEKVYEKKEMLKQLEAALRKLTSTERRLLRNYYQDGISLLELEKKEGITKQALSYRHRKILEKLHYHSMGDE